MKTYFFSFFALASAVAKSPSWCQGTSSLCTAAAAAVSAAAAVPPAAGRIAGRKRTASADRRKASLEKGAGGVIAAFSMAAGARCGPGDIRARFSRVEQAGRRTPGGDGPNGTSWRSAPPSSFPPTRSARSSGIKSVGHPAQLDRPDRLGPAVGDELADRVVLGVAHPGQRLRAAEAALGRRVVNERERSPEQDLARQLAHAIVVADERPGVRPRAGPELVALPDLENRRGVDLHPALVRDAVGTGMADLGPPADPGLGGVGRHVARPLGFPDTLAQQERVLLLRILRSYRHRRFPASGRSFWTRDRADRAGRLGRAPRGEWYTAGTALGYGVTSPVSAYRLRRARPSSMRPLWALPRASLSKRSPR